jgi:hypothetical protein
LKARLREEWLKIQCRQGIRFDLGVQEFGRRLS